MEETLTQVATDQTSADNFLFSLLKGYAVASIGWWLLKALDRIGSPKRNSSQYVHDDSCLSEEDSDDDDTDGELSDSKKPAIDCLWSVEDAVHDITADVDTAFCLYHYTRPDIPVPLYIIMMYDSKSASFTYWCDQTPPWDVLQCTARKFVTENRCSALYACAKVTTETESSDNDDDTATEKATADGQTDSTEVAETTVSEEDERKSLTTRIENVYVKIGRVSHFRTPEKAIPKNAEVNYKNFATMRNRAGGERMTTTL